jgi:hypothetical protein
LCVSCAICVDFLIKWHTLVYHTSICHSPIVCLVFHVDMSLFSQLSWIQHYYLVQANWADDICTISKKLRFWWQNMSRERWFRHILTNWTMYLQIYSSSKLYCLCMFEQTTLRPKTQNDNTGTKWVDNLLLAMLTCLYCICPSASRPPKHQVLLLSETSGIGQNNHKMTEMSEILSPSVVWITNKLTHCNKAMKTACISVRFWYLRWRALQDICSERVKSSFSLLG